MKQEEIVNRDSPNVWSNNTDGLAFQVQRTRMYFYVVGKDESMIRFCIPFCGRIPLA